MGRLYGVDQMVVAGDRKARPLSNRSKGLERFLEESYAEAVNGWPANPPENSKAVPATFRFKDRRPVAVKCRPSHSSSREQRVNQDCRSRCSQ